MIGMFNSIGFLWPNVSISTTGMHTSRGAGSQGLTAFLVPVTFWYFEGLFLLSEYSLSIHCVLHKKRTCAGSGMELLKPLEVPK